jgi:hypothetical protein
MTELSLEVGGSALQESPDTVILAGQSGLEHQPLAEHITQPLFLRVCPRNPKACSCLR